MPKPPNPKSKSINLILTGKPEWETEIRAFKEICARDRIEISIELFKRGVQGFLRDHNWPPGNPQTPLTSFGFQSKTRCGYCGEMAEKVQRVEYVSGSIIPSCDSCLTKNRDRGLVKNVWETL